MLQVPSVLNRLVPLPDEGDGQRRFVLLEDVIGPRLDALFGGFKVAARASFRVTRNSDLTIQETEVKSSLLSTIQENLRQRKWGAAVRLEILDRADEDFLAQLQTAPALDLDDRDVYKVAGPIDLTALVALCRLEGFRELKEPPFEPQMPASFASRANVFAAIREQDILVHHPYESFGSVVQFIEQAAEDPHVLAIKQTLYRTADDNPIINALARAAENGKQVTALVELQARLDEENNIVKARRLQKAGVHVVYGMVGLKTHCKAALVVRREHDGIRRYVHLATGNYNPTTARFYTDLCLFTCRARVRRGRQRPVQPADRLLAGARLEQADRRPDAPGRPDHRADRPRAPATPSRACPARIIAKMNSLVDPAAIEALYAASQAGVRIDLIVRGICCLRPGLPGVSENIRVISIVDKFLEHSRIFYFQNGEQPEVFLSSADWMPRNFRRRVEVMFPIEDPRLQNRIVDGILGVVLLDNVKARVLQPDGTYQPRRRRHAPASPRSARRSSSRTWPASSPAPTRSARRRWPPARPACSARRCAWRAAPASAGSRTDAPAASIRQASEEPGPGQPVEQQAAAGMVAQGGDAPLAQLAERRAGLPVIRRPTRSDQAGLWPTSISRDLGAGGDPVADRGRVAVGAEGVGGLQSAVRLQDVGHDLRRPEGAGQGAGHDPVELDAQPAEPAGDSPSRLLPLGGQRALVVGDVRRAVRDGDPVSEQVESVSSAGASRVDRRSIAHESARTVRRGDGRRPASLPGRRPPRRRAGGSGTWRCRRP